MNTSRDDESFAALRLRALESCPGPPGAVKQPQRFPS
jgi:hypothetical protein